MKMMTHVQFREEFLVASQELLVDAAFDCINHELVSQLIAASGFDKKFLPMELAIRLVRFNAGNKNPFTSITLGDVYTAIRVVDGELKSTGKEIHEAKRNLRSNIYTHTIFSAKNAEKLDKEGSSISAVYCDIKYDGVLRAKQSRGVYYTRSTVADKISEGFCVVAKNLIWGRDYSETKKNMKKLRKL